jgi:tetratricopeptide (TPR) repeat protein
VGIAALAALLIAPALAQYSDPNLASGWDHFYNVEYDEAIADFQKAVDARPSDPNRQNALAEGILFRMMYRAGALETEFATGSNPFLRRPKMNPTPEEEQRFGRAIQTTLSLCGPRLERNARDEDAMYAQGVALGLRGNYNYLVRKAWLDALRDLTAGRKLHNRLSEIDPARVDARLLQGVHDYIVGSLPFSYRMLGFLAGVRGDREQGVRTLQLVAQKGVLNKVDAEIMLAVIYRREKRPADAIPICNDLLRRFPRNFLVLFELSQMYGDAGDKANALAALDRVEQMKKAGAPGYKSIPLEKLDYARGNILFWFDDFVPAMRNFKQAAAHAEELDPYTGVMAWMRLGQTYDLLGRRSEALSAYRSAIAYAPESDAARESKRYIASPYRRPKTT